MTTKTIDVHEVKPDFKELLSLVGEGTEIILTEGDTPLARITPVKASPTSRIPGLHTGAIWTSTDFDNPLSDEFWTGTP